MPDRDKVIKGLECCSAMSGDECQKCPYGHECRDTDLPYGMPHLAADALALLKEQEAVEPKTIPEELKLKMWNAFYAEEDKFEKKYVGTKEHNSWFFIYRPWLQVGFNIAIKAIADWEGR